MHLPNEEIDEIVKINHISKRPCCMNFGEGSTVDENGVWCHCKKPSVLQDGTCADCIYAEKSVEIMAQSLREAGEENEGYREIFQAVNKILMKVEAQYFDGSLAERVQDVVDRNKPIDKVALWEAINRYAETIGGFPDRLAYGNIGRQKAVVAIEKLVFPNE